MSGLMNAVKLVAMLALIKTIDFTDPTNVMLLRWAFGVVQGLCWLALLVIYLKVVRRNDQTKVTVLDDGLGAEMSGEDPVPVTKTVDEYYKAQLHSLVVKVGMANLVVIGLHYKWDIMPPLLMQCMMNPQQIYSHQLFALFILGEDDAKHPVPWVQPKPFDFANMSKWQPEQRVKRLKQEKEIAQMRKQNTKAIKASQKAD